MKPRFMVPVMAAVLCAALSFAQDNAESPKEALNVYSDAAGFQNNGQFDLAAEEWEKFLKRFPTDTLANKARYYAGVCQQQLKAYDKAAAHYEAVLKADPKFELAEDAMMNLGWCRYSQGKAGQGDMYGKAADSFAQLIKSFDKGKFVDQALWFLGETLYAQGKKPEAIAAYRKLVEDQDKSLRRPDALYAWGATHEELKQFKEAGEVYDRFLKEFDSHALATEVRMHKAETLLQAGDAAAAEKLLGEVAAVQGFAFADHATFRQAFCAAQQKKYSEAGNLYAKLSTDFPQSAYLKEAAVSAGRSFYNANELGESAKWFQKVIDSDPANAVEAAHWLCRIYLTNKESPKAVELAAKILPNAGESPYTVALKLDQADALYVHDEWRADSLDKYIAIVNEHANHELAPQALYYAGFTAMELQKYDQGLKLAGDFLGKYPQDRFLPDAKYVAADCQLKLNQYAEAETGYRDLLKNYANHSELNTWRVRLGLVLYLQKKYPEAVTWLQGVVAELKLPDQVAESQFILGVSQFHQNQFEPAVQALAAALAADPQWRQADEALLYLSRAQRGLKQLDAAKTSAAKLISEFPQSNLLDHAHFRLGEYNYAAGDYAAATAAYDIVLTKWPESTFAPYAFYGKGWSLLKAGQFAPAADSFTALIGEYEKNELVPDAYFARGMCRRQAGDAKNAVADIDAFLKTNPAQSQKADALYERGLSLVALKDLDQAVTTFEALLADNKDYPSAPNVLYELGWAHKNRGQDEPAVAAFAKLAANYADSPLAPEANLHVAEEQYKQAQYEEAAKAYTAAKAKAAAGEVAERATHKLGWTHYQLAKYEPALAEFQEHVQAYADGPLAADGLFMVGECLVKLERHADALAAFTKAQQKPSSDKRKQVLTLLHGGQCAGQAGKWQQSLEWLDQIPAKHSDSEYLAEALYERGWAKQNLKQMDEAIEDYTQAAEKSRGAVGARAQFMIGEVLFEQKKFDEAIRSFKRVMYGFANATNDVKSWQALSGYEAGRCAEVQVSSQQDPERKGKLLADAKASFTYVIERHAEHEKAKLAKERLAELAKLEGANAGR